MYADRWSPALRQGDILGPVPIPLLGTRFEIISESRSLTEEVSASAKGKVIIEADYSHVAVISHDCEFNENKRNKLLVARLQRLPGNLTDERTIAVWASNNVEARAESGESIAAVDNFALEPCAGVFDAPHVVSFTTVTPLPMSMATDLVAVKKAELTHDIRELFRKKLAWFFGRAADDIPDDEKRDAPRSERPE